MPDLNRKSINNRARDIDVANSKLLGVCNCYRNIKSDVFGSNCS